MHKLIVLVIALSAVAFATTRTPIATIPTASGNNRFAAQNDIIVVGDGGPSSGLMVYQVGTWKQIATLNFPSSNIGVAGIAIQDDYVAVGVFNFSDSQGETFIFQKPSGGWATEGVSAILTASDGTQLGGTPAVWGNTLISPNRGVAYVFVEPMGGWVDATETAQLTASDNPPYFGGGAAITGPVGSGGNLVVVGSGTNAYVFVEPQGGWASMTQTAELAGNGFAAGLTAAKSTIAFVTFWQQTERGDLDQIYIYTEPEGGWANASTPNFTAVAASNDGMTQPTLSQDAEVLVAGLGSSDYKAPHLSLDRTYLWHANKNFGPTPIKLSTGLGSVYGATVAGPYAYAWDEDSVFVFDGK
ncbi:MAG TPA: hypothetical protein VF753_07680 [Terriglobales bacterium]